jgi:hypothetical protein
MRAEPAAAIPNGKSAVNPTRKSGSKLSPGGRNNKRNELNFNELPIIKALLKGLVNFLRTFCTKFFTSPQASSNFLLAHAKIPPHNP